MEDYAILVGFALWMIINILSNGKKKTKGKKSAPPAPPSPNPMGQGQGRGASRGTGSRNIGFEIPHIDGAPPVAVDAVEEDDARLAEQQEWQRQQEEQRRIQEERRMRLEAAKKASALLCGGEGSRAERSHGPISPDALVSAVIFAEILGRPKAQVRRNPYARR